MLLTCALVEVVPHTTFVNESGHVRMLLLSINSPTILDR